MKAKTDEALASDTLAATARRIIARAASKLEISAPEFARRVRGEA